MVVYVNDTTGKNCVLLNSVQEWLFGCFFHMLTQSVRFYTIQRVQMFEKDYSSNRQ